MRKAGNSTEQRAAYDDETELLAHAQKIYTPLTFPCGRSMPNRLVKVPLYEHFGPIWGGPPHEGHYALYVRWSSGGWGMVATGNVQVDKRHISMGRDLLIPDVLTPETLAPWRRLAQIMHTGRDSDEADGMMPAPSLQSPLGPPLALLQLSHSGRQSLNFLGGRLPFEPPLAPSPIRLGHAHAAKDGWFSRLLHQLAYQVPREMTHADIQVVIAQFVRGARLAVESGFDGVQIHAAHGYLLTQFISPKTNTRTDEYSADKDPLRLVREIVHAVRAAVPNDFIVGMKLNSADYTRESAQPERDRALDHVREIGRWGLVDYIEVSGGDYEDPQFIDSSANFKSPRQVLFESFAERSVEILAESTPPNRAPPLVCLTGGLNTLPKMASVLARSHAHMLGIGRASIIHPDLPVKLYESLQKRLAGAPDEFLMVEPPELSEDGLGVPPPTYLSWRSLERLILILLKTIWSFVPLEFPRLFGAGQNVSWHNMMLRRIAFGREVDYTKGTIATALEFFLCTTPYPLRKGGQGKLWWVMAGLIGVAIGLGLGQFL
ncbi:hypothetical protein BN946_scf185006.g6 [Trametes cinnabarina]|uniref:NADH:flavin oxidoreductase/NADH oxidase N-terminal domain-containing protein n=1 Tax=Pycnoporus cinnabarinus TaxID=5643 RepID=A0A060SXG4_PYCCI|nr:hypothetical protein BN946_scf185006.g6 [Trametes cinnabarina]